MLVSVVKTKGTEPKFMFSDRGMQTSSKNTHELMDSPYKTLSTDHLFMEAPQAKRSVEVSLFNSKIFNWDYVVVFLIQYCDFTACDFVASASLMASFLICRDDILLTNKS